MGIRVGSSVFVAVGEGSGVGVWVGSEVRVTVGSDVGADVAEGATVTASVGTSVGKTGVRVGIAWAGAQAVRIRIKGRM